MNKTKEKKTVKTSKHGFYTVLGIIVFALIAAGVLSVCEKELNWIDYENQVFASIGIVCQIVSGIVCCVQSILGLSISLQHQDFLDIPLSKYYALRIRPFFDFRLSSIISFLLLLVSAISFLFSIVIMCVSAAIISVGFCFYLLCVEIPFLMLKEKPILEIVKDRIIMEYNGKIDANNYQTREFVEILESLICNKDLRWVYNQLSINDQTDYNKKLLYRLLDVQSNMAFHLDKIESKSALVKVTDGMLTTVCDMTSSDFDIVEILGPQTHDYMYFLTRVFFCLLKNPQSKEKAEERIAQLIANAFVPTKSEEYGELAFVVLTKLIIDTIKTGDLSLVSHAKKAWSQFPYSLHSEGVSARIFAMTSCLIYYLAEIEDTVPPETKESIRLFIKSSSIQDNWEVFSWKELFHEFANSFSVPFSVFFSDYQNHWNYLDCTIYSSRARCVALSDEYISDWFFANFFNSEKAFGDLDYEKEFCVQNDRNQIEYLKKLEDECYSSEDRSFKVPEKLFKLASYFSVYEPTFLRFQMNEERNYSFRNYVDKLREREFDQIAQEASLVKIQDIMDRYQPLLEEAVQNSFGFDSQIDLSKEKKLYFSFITERKSQAINIDQVITNRFLFSLFLELRKSVLSKKEKVIQIGDSYLQEVKNLLKRNIRYASGDVLFCAYKISDEKVKEEFRRKVSKAEAIKDAPGLFPKPTIIIGEGFKFNCNLTFLANELTFEQLGQIADQYRRADGQYIYQGSFWNRDKLMDHIRQTKVLIQIVFSYKVKTQRDSIVALDTLPHE